jgi:hypothetical protein
MKRTLLLLIAIATVGCASVGPEKNDNPKISPTSMTGVTSTKGSNVYEKIPLPATSTAR